MHKIFALTACAALAACAQSPDAIAPVSMGNAYAGMSCAEARAALAQERITLDAATVRQNNRRTADGINIVLFGVFGAAANAAIGGDEAGTIAASKGKILSLEARVAGCR